MASAHEHDSGNGEDEPPAFRNTALSDALQTQDLAAVAFALRHGPTIVPLVPAGNDNVGEVWTYRDPSSGYAALFLFSDSANMPAALPPDVALNSPGWLRAFLALHRDDIATVFLDVGGPHPMQAKLVDLTAALDA